MTTIDEIKKIIDEEIKPMLEHDGGSLEVIDFKDGVLSIKLQGACSDCPFSTYTLKDGIERTLKEKFPEVKEVISI